jgi:putative addiction module component (TIGR02574 family)
MSMTVDQLEAEALKLPTELRVQLAETLLASVDDEGIAIDQASLDEAKRRYEELRSGAVQGESLDEVIASLRAPRG